MRKGGTALQLYNVDTVKRNTLAQQVMEQIISLLFSGQLRPGDRLPPEMQLMEQLDVSRPVIREALSSLETLEVITRKPRGGTFVNEKVGSSPFRAMLAISINNLPAVIEARMTLELGLVTIAAEKITDSELAELAETIENIRKNDEDYGMYDKQFHRIIAYSAKNPIVEGMIESLLMAHEKTDSLIKVREPELTIQYHTEIYEALKKRDPIEAFQKMYNHLSYVRDKILSDHNKS
ncbi:FadR/GntR family transcriptional regulator [Sporosarcina thermotolerans]|uniref:FadR/GntR family transcriptional regulator n=2 Tax=Sporosarcina thermotolerans TaxID=633404 RepID=A0AAW9A4U0_9BACL|nr:FadR/GntR family transcriptional regulator [Sporosarcina thermotolerans]MDW0116117.1 FadR/GntR family transcriptional regulator [Sporosarcina thermotolerans]WHT48085.1 FadR/GntR family transcriptional regulator [Sporosarcina thermotolerans]